MVEHILPELPSKVELETIAVLKQAAQAHRYLGELKGVARTIIKQGRGTSMLSTEVHGRERKKKYRISNNKS